MPRRAFLRRGAIGGAAVLLPLELAPRAEASVPDADLTYLRLLIAVELLKIDHGVRAGSSGRLRSGPMTFIRRVIDDDKRHYHGLAALMNAAGQPPATGTDVDFSYPRGAFATQASIAKLGRRLATLATGAYLGALENVQTPELRRRLAQIAANEAQQAGAYAQLLGGRVVGSAFAPSLAIDAVSEALDEFES